MIKIRETTRPFKFAKMEKESEVFGFRTKDCNVEHYGKFVEVSDNLSFKQRAIARETARLLKDSIDKTKQNLFIDCLLNEIEISKKAGYSDSVILNLIRVTLTNTRNHNNG